MEGRRVAYVSQGGSLMECKSCGAVNFDGAKKCMECGASMGRPQSRPDSAPEIRLEETASSAPASRTGLVVGIVAAVGLVGVLGLFLAAGGGSGSGGSGGSSVVASEGV